MKSDGKLRYRTRLAPCFISHVLALVDIANVTLKNLKDHIKNLVRTNISNWRARVQAKLLYFVTLQKKCSNSQTRATFIGAFRTWSCSMVEVGCR